MARGSRFGNKIWTDLANTLGEHKVTLEDGYEYELDVEGGKTMRVIICSLGSIGKKYARIIKETWPQTTVGALRSGLSNDSCKYIDRSFTTEEEAINWNPQAAVIASPANQHLQQALVFTAKNIPTLIEKPIGTGEEREDEWKELAKRSQETPVYVGYILRQDPGAKILKELIRKKKMGRLISARFYCGSWLPDWRPDSDYRKCVSARKDLGGGAALELSHEIDMALYLLGDLDINHSECWQSKALDIETEDQCLVVGRDCNGCLVTIEIDYCTKKPERYVSIRGSEGSIYWDLIQGTITQTAEGEKSEESVIGLKSDERFYKQLSLFWNASKQGGHGLCTIDEALKVLNIIKDINRS